MKSIQKLFFMVRYILIHLKQEPNNIKPDPESLLVSRHAANTNAFVMEEVCIMKLSIIIWF